MIPLAASLFFIFAISVVIWQLIKLAYDPTSTINSIQRTIPFDMTLMDSPLGGTEMTEEEKEYQMKNILKNNSKNNIEIHDLITDEINSL